MGIEASRRRPDEAISEREHLVVDRLARLLKWSLAVGIALVVLGSLVSLGTDRRLPTATVPISELPALLSRLDGDAFITLGILALLISPGVGLVYLAGAYASMHDRRFALLALAVLLILIISVPVGLLTRGP